LHCQLCIRPPWYLIVYLLVLGVHCMCCPTLNFLQLCPWGSWSSLMKNGVDLDMTCFCFVYGRVLIVRLIDWLFTVLRPAQEYFTYMETSPMPVKGCTNLGLCLALRAFEQGGIFIVPHLLWHGTSVFPVLYEGLPHSVASYDTRRDVEDLF
jgi:hypothetical protein